MRIPETRFGRQARIPRKHHPVYQEFSTKPFRIEAIPTIEYPPHQAGSMSDQFSLPSPPFAEPDGDRLDGAAPFICRELKPLIFGEYEGPEMGGGGAGQRNPSGLGKK